MFVPFSALAAKLQMRGLRHFHQGSLKEPGRSGLRAACINATFKSNQEASRAHDCLPRLGSLECRALPRRGLVCLGVQ